MTKIEPQLCQIDIIMCQQIDGELIRGGYLSQFNSRNKMPYLIIIFFQANQIFCFITNFR